VLNFAIDAYRLVAEPRTSGAAYVTRMVRALVETGSVGSIHLLLSRRPGRDFLFDELLTLPGTRAVWPGRPLHPEAGMIQNILWIQRAVPELLARSVRDVHCYIAPYHQTPVRLPRQVRVATVIHDLCGISRLAGYTPLNKAYYLHRFNFLTAQRRADRLIPISEFTRAQLLKYMPSAAGRVTAPLYNAVTTATVSATDAINVIARWGLQRGTYFVAFGGGGKRKGVDLTLAAFADYRGLGGKARLMLIGGSKAQLEANQRLPKEVWETVNVVKDIPDYERDCLYRGAIALLFPSRCEGFGYPLVEAMKQGCPPIAWEATPAREIVSDVVPLLPELDTERLSEAMAAYDRARIERAELESRLIARARAFSGRSFGDDLLRLLAG